MVAVSHSLEVGEVGKVRCNRDNFSVSSQLLAQSIR
jgi:hypothetical protein